MGKGSWTTLWSKVFVEFLVRLSLVRTISLDAHRFPLDRRAIKWDPHHHLGPASFRLKTRPGDFELNSLQLEDVLITVYQPGDFRPFTFSIFRADVPSLRKQWLFYDLLRAENIVGQFDNCLFSLHRPQSISRTTEVELMDGKWERIVRLFFDSFCLFGTYSHISNFS
jgi:distribution and morphology protein 31